MQTKTEQLEKSVRVAEREYSKKMVDLNKGFEVCIFVSPIQSVGSHLEQAAGQSFSTMENKMNQVGRTAIRIGETGHRDNGSPSC